ncbi:MAG TPA: hypothetical protein VL989_03335 [Candidatus Sulfotelmatobacter sp.]|nr:hypothetical protein [Candidatus Sulfotelmatobacter sp.]
MEIRATTRTHVLPELEEGEESSFVTVRFGEDISPATVLHALIGKGSKFYDEKGLDGRHYDRRHVPWLSAIAIEEGSITFRDRNFLNTRWDDAPPA